MTTATRNASQAPAIYRVTDKSGQCLGYLVPSDSGDTMYQVTYRDHQYHCTCADHTYRGRQCKHIAAVLEVVAIRKQAGTPAPASEVVVMTRLFGMMVLLYAVPVERPVTGTRTCAHCGRNHASSECFL